MVVELFELSAKDKCSRFDIIHRIFRVFQPFGVEYFSHFKNMQIKKNAQW